MKTENYKYTNDGKKVAVVGKLNSREWIVTEIFVAPDGSEIPSGESFIEKSLHDAPLVSWKEQELNKLEKRYKSEREEWECKIETSERALKQKYDILYEKSKGLQQLISNLEKPESRLEFIRFLDFLSGRIKWLVIDGYPPKIVEFEKYPIDTTWRGRCDGIKLVTLFGNSKGSLSYRINEYSDGSGGSTNIYPYTCYEDAFEKFREIVLNAGICEKIIELAENYNITLDGKKLSEYYAGKRESVKKDIKRLESQVEDYKNSLSKLEQKYDKLINDENRQAL
jgi:hypothetical protein